MRQGRQRGTKGAGGLLTAVLIVSGVAGTAYAAPASADAGPPARAAAQVAAPRAVPVAASPVSARGRVLLSATDQARSTAVAITTGATLWSRNTTLTARAANPAGDRLYLSTRGRLMAVNARTGAVAWNIPNTDGPLAADGRRVYVASAGRVRAFSAGNGGPLWVRAVPAPGRPIRAGRLLYTVAGNGALVVLSPATGKVVRAGAPYTGLTSHAVAAGGKLYLTAGQSLRTYSP